MNKRAVILLAAVAATALAVPSATAASCKAVVVDPPNDTSYANLPIPAKAYDVTEADIASKGDTVTATIRVADIDAMDGPHSIAVGRRFLFLWQGPGASQQPPVYYGLEARVPWNWRPEFGPGTSAIEYWFGSSTGLHQMTPLQRATGSFDANANEVRMSVKLSELGKIVKKGGSLKQGAKQTKFIAEVTTQTNGSPIDFAESAKKVVYPLGAKSCAKVGV